MKTSPLCPAIYHNLLLEITAALLRPPVEYVFAPNKDAASRGYCPLMAPQHWTLHEGEIVELDGIEYTATKQPN